VTLVSPKELEAKIKSKTDLYEILAFASKWNVINRWLLLAKD